MRALPTGFGQALVEFALLAPVLMLMLLGVMAAGLFFLAAQGQQNAAGTLAAWTAANPAATAAEADAMAAAVIPCAGGATIATDDGLVIVTVSCPSLAHSLIPAFPEMVTVTASAYSEVPIASPAP